MELPSEMILYIGFFMDVRSEYTFRRCSKTLNSLFVGNESNLNYWRTKYQRTKIDVMKKTYSFIAKLPARPKETADWYRNTCVLLEGLFHTPYAKAIEITKRKAEQNDPITFFVRDVEGSIKDCPGLPESLAYVPKRYDVAYHSGLHARFNFVAPHWLWDDLVKTVDGTVLFAKLEKRIYRTKPSLMVDGTTRIDGTRMKYHISIHFWEDGTYTSEKINVGYVTVEDPSGMWIEYLVRGSPSDIYQNDFPIQTAELNYVRRILKHYDLSTVLR
jgi:hypothetical protein